MAALTSIRFRSAYRRRRSRASPSPTGAAPARNGRRSFPTARSHAADARARDVRRGRPAPVRLRPRRRGESALPLDRAGDGVDDGGRVELVGPVEAGDVARLAERLDAE